jgi:hypothetical protein
MVRFYYAVIGVLFDWIVRATFKSERRNQN